MIRFYYLTILFFVSLVALAQKPSTNSDFESEPTVKWRFKATAPFFSSPVISEGVAFIGGVDSTVYAIDVQTGNMKWKVKTNGEIRSTLSIHKDKLYLLGGNGVLSCFDKNTGKVAWRKVFDNNALFLGERKYDFADYFQSSLLIHEGVIYFGGGNNFINAVKLEDGETLWKFKANDIVHTRPAIDGNKVFAGCFDGYLYALNISDGSLAWKFKSIGQQYFPKGEVQGFPATGFGSVFVGARDFNFYAIDVETGQGKWNRSFPKGWAFSATVKDSVLFLGTAEDRLMLAIDARTGQELWQTDLKFHIFGNCEFSQTLVYVPTIWGKLYALDRKTGSIKWVFATDGYKANHLRYYKQNDSYRDDIYNIFKSSLDLIKAEYNMGGIFSTPVISGDMMILTTTEGIVYGLKKLMNED